MALVKCHECGGPVSTSAKTCPHCGAKPRWLGWVVNDRFDANSPDPAVVAVFLLLVSFILGLAGWSVWNALNAH